MADIVKMSTRVQAEMLITCILPKKASLKMENGGSLLLLISEEESVISARSIAFTYSIIEDSSSIWAEK